ncbi:MAG TPA: hypothetical protein VFQ45_12660 [Longimicrobium sp.]|nr:hypothetical protein [Longimicrobium sp.]
MALREFTDSRGITWRAWDVPPAHVYSPERSGEDRRRQPAPGYAPERRLRERRRVSLNLGMERGWLCFECPDEKRRLAPPPPSWAESTDEDLETLCQRALASLRPPRIR